MGSVSFFKFMNYGMSMFMQLLSYCWFAHEIKSKVITAINLILHIALSFRFLTTCITFESCKRNVVPGFNIIIPPPFKKILLRILEELRNVVDI